MLPHRGNMNRVCVCACVLLFDLLMKSKNWKQMMEAKYFRCILWNKGSVWSWLSHPALISSLFLFFKTNFYLFHRPPCWLPGDNVIVVRQNTNEMYFYLYICGISLGRGLLEVSSHWEAFFMAMDPSCCSGGIIWFFSLIVQKRFVTPLDVS